jgi:O-antigen ligase
VVLMGIVLLAPQAYFPTLIPFRVALVTAGAATVVHVLQRVTSGGPISVGCREMKLVAALLVWVVLTIPLSYWRGGSVDTVTETFGKSLVLFWLVANTVTTVRRFRQLAWGVTLMSVPIALAAVSNHVSGTFARGSERIAGYQAPLTSNPNDLALTLNLIVPFVLVFVRSSRSCLIRVSALGIVILDVVAVLLTLSRGGVLTLVTILVSVVWSLFRSWRIGWAVALLAVLLTSAPFLPSTFWDRWGTITDLEGDATGSAQARRNQVMDALRFVGTHPLVGAGIGAGVLGLRDQGVQSWSEIHNVYLQYAVDLGLPGLALYLALVVTSFRSASSARQRAGAMDDARGVACLADATRLSLLAFVVAALFHPVAYNFYFYYLAGLAVAASRLVTGPD